MFQDKALAILKSGKSVFLTGPAGSGKTHVLNTYINYLRDHGIPVAVTASTGIAATHMQGTTVHSWTGIGIKDDMSHNDLRSLRSKKYLVKNIEKAEVLIIDEISMLHRKQLDLINRVLRYMRNSPEPFGGMQVVLAGDFFQLPPVSKREESNREKFAFMSSAWLDVSPVICYLTEQHRQSENSLNRLLIEMRQREISDDTIETIQEAQQQESLDPDPTRLFTHNADVDAINRKRLDELETSSEIYIAKTKGNKKILETMRRSMIVRETVELKVGAKVMFLKNDHEKGVMNGTLGQVASFDSETRLPMVKLLDKRKVLAEHAIWSIEDEKGKTIASFEQVPLRLAWAITVHKSQGMTLDAAEIDLSKTFERGQGYVALSRLKDIQGLKLLGINRLALEVDALAAKADDRFITLSEEADQASTIEDLEKQYKKFILKCGGSIEIKSRSKGIIKSKGSTYSETLALLEQGKTIKEICKIRDVTVPTVIRHLTTLRKQDPKNHFDHIKPDDQTLKQVKSIINKASKAAKKDDYTQDGKLKVTWVYKQLKGKFDFNTLRLAMLYIE